MDIHSFIQQTYIDSQLCVRSWARATVVNNTEQTLASVVPYSWEAQNQEEWKMLKEMAGGEWRRL